MSLPLMSLPFPRRDRNQRSSRKRRKILALEQCESRELLAVFTVTSPLDNNATGTLRWAVNSANSNPGTDTVVFDSNITAINLTQGQIGITDNVRINTPAAAPGFVTINAAANSRIFEVNDNSVDSIIIVNMNGLSLRGGNVSNLAAGEGGAILNREHLELARCLVSENVATSGGGVANHGYLSTENCEFAENVATISGGGAILNGDYGIANVLGGTMTGNEATSGSGGAILSASNGLVTVGGGVTIESNTAAGDGGGLAAVGGSTVWLEDAAFTSNTAVTGGGVHVADPGSWVTGSEGTLINWNGADRGGGLAAGNQAGTLLRGSVVTGNLAHVDGGGVWINGRSNVTLRGAEVTSNIAGFGPVDGGRGGGVFSSGASTVNVENTNVSYNGLTAILAPIDEGGGIFAGDGVDLTITDSRFNTNVARKGGGVFGHSRDLTNLITTISISDTLIENNNSYEAGGGIYGGEALDLFLKCVTITGNSSFIGSGGGVHLEGAPSPRHVFAQFVDTSINWNNATGQGAGLASVGGVQLSVLNSSVTNNSAIQRGGGMYLTGGVDGAGDNHTTISTSLISGNIVGDDSTTSPQDGGGVWAGYGAEVAIDTTTIEGNTADISGGGLHIQGASAFRLTDSTVSGNQSGGNGGGASVIRSNATFLQTTFYANIAAENGGGFYVIAGGAGDVNINHSTISLNSAALSGTGKGGGIFVGAQDLGSGQRLHLNHTIVSTNLGPPLGGFDEVFDSAAQAGFLLVDANFSLLRDNVGTLFAPGNPDPNGNIIGSAANPIDAQLGPLSNNGGPTLTMVPSNASPAINAGSPLFVGIPAYDQRQMPFKRVFLHRIDMGAVEVQPPPPTPDFDGDGVADCTDINALTLEIALATHSGQFDLTGDGFVDLLDLDQWLDDAPDVNGLAIERYLYGDANLDGLVNGRDFLIWNANKFTLNTDWCAGNFNGDGVVNAEDFDFWHANKFTESPPLTGCGFLPAESSQRDTTLAEFQQRSALTRLPEAGPLPAVNLEFEALEVKLNRPQADQATTFETQSELTSLPKEWVSLKWVGIDERHESSATERPGDHTPSTVATLDAVFGAV